MISIEERQRVVLDLSVYNALSNMRKDGAAHEVVQFLSMAGWHPAWAAFEEVVSTDSVFQSAKRLEDRGLLKTEGPLLSIPFRDPNGFGQPVKINKSRTDLCWRGKPE